MIVAGLLSHGEAPERIPELGDAAEVVVAVNARVSERPTPWLGFGANHNRLMDAHRDADWYVALNPDANISAEQLATLIEQAEHHRYSLVGPLRYEPWGLQGEPSEGLPTPSHFLKATVRTSRFKRNRPRPPWRSGGMVDTAWVAGCCMAIRGDLLRELRFDESYFMYFEDVDICQRARIMGARVGVCTAVAIDHASGWSAGDRLVSNRGVEYARSAILYARLHGHSAQIMRMAALAWALPRVYVPGRTLDERVQARVFARGLLAPARTGLSELAAAHNDRYRADFASVSSLASGPPSFVSGPALPCEPAAVGQLMAGSWTNADCSEGGRHAC